MRVKYPKIIIRMGTHAEKNYIIKTSNFIDGIMIGANLLEVTPSATASLIVKLNRPYLIDPMTYAFGSYIDKIDNKKRTDLDWIKSFSANLGKKVFKKSYTSLVEYYGTPFREAISKSTALNKDNLLNNNCKKEICTSVAEYQLNRIKQILQEDEEYAKFAANIELPMAVFAPYFYIEPENPSFDIDLIFELGAQTAELKIDAPVHMIICADNSELDNQEFLKRIKSDLIDTGVDGVWFWFSNFKESDSNINRLKSFRELIENLGDSLDVYNLHGGFFSLILSRYGLNGISHGIGYGEQKDVVPVIGKASPHVSYYLPDLHRTLAVPSIQRAFKDLGINSVEDFYTEICDCAICKGVIKNDVEDFSEYGDMDYSNIDSQKKTQTPTAAKLSRFHYLINRLKERDWAAKHDINLITDSLQNSSKKWMQFPTIKKKCSHLNEWLGAIK